MGQDKTGYEVPTDNKGSFYLNIRAGDKEAIQKAFKDWKPKAYPYEKRITQDSLNETCANCDEDGVHYQFYLPKKNSRYQTMRYVDGANYCKHDENECLAPLCSDCANDNDCEICGAEMCASCAKDSEYIDNQKICVECREFQESFDAESFGNRGHKLMPKGLSAKIPKLNSQENIDDPMVVAHFFSPYARRADWFVIEWDGEDVMFGLADLGYPEMGYWTLSELESARRGNLPLVERDLHWKPVPLSEVEKTRAETFEAVENKEMYAETFEARYNQNGTIAYNEKEWVGDLGNERGAVFLGSDGNDKYYYLHKRIVKVVKGLKNETLVQPVIDFNDYRLDDLIHNMDERRKLAKIFDEVMKNYDRHTEYRRAETFEAEHTLRNLGLGVVAVSALAYFFSQRK